jgi:LPXTG-site transpeptidase (sortase) family protein
MKALNSTKLAIIGLALTVSGLFGVVPVLYNSDDAAIAASSTSSQPVPAATEVAKQAPEPSVTSGHPVRVVAPTVNVDMPVVDGFYNAASGDWTLNDDKAQFASMTTEPNTKAGQTFIYGHATQRVFGKLLNMHTNDQVYVYTSNGYKFVYTLKQTEVVTPQNTNILSYTGAPRLLLQTCVGTFSESRKFFILEFTQVEKV